MSICLRKCVWIFPLFALMLCVRAYAVSWFPFGPDGGDARSLAVDPHDHAHLYLGTATGWIYESRNEGEQWKRLTRLSNRDDLVLDNIVVDKADPKHMLVGAWVVDRSDGGLFVSKDGGVTWTNQETMRGQSIRSLAQASSDPKVWIAGTLKGVRRSEDNGEHWQPISPEGSTEIHEVESVAIDPGDPQIIYAGTWHLPWKTIDGGVHWSSVKDGVIDDSDVFSIIVDPVHPATVYASACSGIYKSENSGGRFQKVQGIPSEARRTRVLMQDSKNRDIVFAGTTEGLFRTADAGKIWIRITGPEVIVNDVYVDPTDSNKMLVATDRGGVLASNDGGSSFHPSNTGFSARLLSSFVADAQHPATVYVGALNDKQLGGVFLSENGGLSWAQRSGGLEGSDIFSLGQAPDGTVLAGTGHGIYRLSEGSWTRIADITFAKKPDVTVGQGAVARGRSSTHSARKLNRTSTAQVPARRSPVVLKPFTGAVYAISVGGDAIFAATSQGLLASGPAGLSWKGLDEPGAAEFYFLGSARSKILAAGLKTMRLSKDNGTSWKPTTPPGELSQISAVAVDGNGALWVGGREGVFLSEDDGVTWQSVKGLFVPDVNSIFYDAHSERILVTAGGKATLAFAVHLPDKKVSFWDTGWNLRFIRPVGDHLLGITPFDGVVVQPRMVDSAESTHP